MTEEEDTTSRQEISVDEVVTTLLETVQDCLAEEDEGTLRLVLNDEHEADLAEVIRHLTDAEREMVFDSLAKPLAAGVLAELDPATTLDVSELITDDEVSELVQLMAPDDAADTLGTLSDDRSDSVLELMGDEEAEEARELLSYPSDTGGGIMNPDLITVREHLSVSEAIDHIREWAEADEVFYVYVVDDAAHLIGTVSLRRLVLTRPDVQLGAIMDRDPVSVTASMDQEEIARMFDRYGYLALPVVSESGTLIGQITFDDIVDVIKQETTEDIYEMAGTSSDERDARSIFGVVRHRMPWLVICLVGTLLSGGVIEAFSETLSQLLALSLFIPAIMAMGGNTGIQTSTVTIRSLATGEVQASQIVKVVWREILISLTMGLGLGIMVSVISFTWTGSGIIGACVGLSMVAAVVLSASIGAVLPLTFWRFGVDPAVASGPLITTLNDIISLTAYFSLALFLMAYFAG